MLPPQAPGPEEDEPIKICVIGAGAMGGLLAARFVLSGEQVTVIDIGEHLAAMRDNGLDLIEPDGRTTRVEGFAASDDPGAVGVQDLVVLGLKAHVIRSVAPRLGALYHDDTIVLPVQNGIPWWYFQRFEGVNAGRTIETVDPGGEVARAIAPRRILGCVTYPAGELIAPGVVRHVEGNRFTLGELDGADSERARNLAEALIRAGFKSFVIDDIRSEIWLKLWGNLSFNPVSAITHATLADICKYPLTRELARTMMEEAKRVAECLGAHFRLPIEKRLEGAEKVGAHKTSMLQDVEAGRRLELDAIIGAVIELGELTGIETPAIATVYALTKLLDETIGAQGAVRTLEAA